MSAVVKNNCGKGVVDFWVGMVRVRCDVIWLVWQWIDYIEEL